MLYAEQIRAARGILKMRQEDLAELTGISLSTIKRLETKDGEIDKASQGILKKIKSAFEKLGIKFLNPEEDDNISGVGLRFYKKS